MVLNIQIKEMDFCGVFMRALPVVREKLPKDGRSVAKIASAVTNLPGEVIGAVLDAIPQEDKCEIAALLVAENKDKICQISSRVLNSKGLEASVEDISLSNGLEFRAVVSNLNYAALAERYLPLIRDALVVQENPVTAMLGALLKLPGMLLYGAIAKIPQDKKDEAVAYLVNRNKDKIIAKLEGILASQGIRIQLADLNVVI